MINLLMLSNGQEIIGEVAVRENKIALTDPLQINYRAIPNQPMPMVSISRYMPFALKSIIEIDKKDVITMAEPCQPMIDYYTHSLSHYRSTIDENVHEELSAAARHMSNQDISTAEEEYYETLENFKYNGPVN